MVSSCSPQLVKGKAEQVRVVNAPARYNLRQDKMRLLRLFKVTQVRTLALDSNSYQLQFLDVWSYTPRVGRLRRRSKQQLMQSKNHQLWL